MLASRPRYKNETYEDYREDLRKEAQDLKEYLQGNIFWNRGTYDRGINRKKRQEKEIKSCAKNVKMEG